MRNRDHQPHRSWQRSSARACVAVLGLIVVVVSQLAATPTPATAAAVEASAGVSHKEPTIRLKLIGTSFTQVYTDGVRWAVYEPREGVTRIMDTIKGTSITRPDPEGCAGGLLAIGGGEMLYACSDPECPEAGDACRVKATEQQCPPSGQSGGCTTATTENYEVGRWIVEDIASGAQHQVNIGKGLPTYSDKQLTFVSGLDAIGSHWAIGGANGRFFVDWHTGHIVYERGKNGDAEAGEEPASADLDYENLDSEALLTPLCRPLARGVVSVQEPTINLVLPRYFPSTYGPPFMIQAQFKPYDHTPDYLQRCGSTQEELIPEIGGSEGQLGGGVLSGYRRLWRLNAHERPWLSQSYLLTGASTRSPLRSQQHTSTMVFETIERPVATQLGPHREGAPTERGPDFYAVWARRLPWANARR
jgi:hypothetical protein